MPKKARAKPVPRDDAEIARDIRRKMRAGADLPDANITIKVVSGAVTLEGTVANILQREAAQSRAAKVKGVRFIENHLSVNFIPPLLEV